MMRKVRLETGDVTQSIKYTNMKTLHKNFQLKVHRTEGSV